MEVIVVESVYLSAHVSNLARDSRLAHKSLLYLWRVYFCLTMSCEMVIYLTACLYINWRNMKVIRNCNLTSLTTSIYFFNFIIFYFYQMSFNYTCIVLKLYLIRTLRIIKKKLYLYINLIFTMVYYWEASRTNGNLVVEFTGLLGSKVYTVIV